MSLQDRAIYRTPDGRRFRAFADTSDPSGAWTLVPAHWNEPLSKIDRDSIGECLALQDEKLYLVNVAGGPLLQDTGWTVADLVLE